jgi:hypothetical protein
MTAGKPFNYRSLLMACAIACLPLAVTAQEAVPLTAELFDLHWVIVDYEGRVDGVGEAPATLQIPDAEFADVGGQTECGYDWSGKIAVALPSVTFSDVEAFYEDSCPAYRNTIALLKALEQVSYAETGPEGLELRAADHRRLLLLVSGG